MGLTEDVTGALASQIWPWSDEGVPPEHTGALNLKLADWRLHLTLHLACELIGFPSQLGTHPGGFVLTQDRFDELCSKCGDVAARYGGQILPGNSDQTVLSGVLRPVHKTVDALIDIIGRWIAADYVGVVQVNLAIFWVVME